MIMMRMMIVSPEAWRGERASSLKLASFYLQISICTSSSCKWIRSTIFTHTYILIPTPHTRTDTPKHTFIYLYQMHMKERMLHTQFIHMCVWSCGCHTTPYMRMSASVSIKSSSSLKPIDKLFFLFCVGKFWLPVWAVGRDVVSPGNVGKNCLLNY